MLKTALVIGMLLIACACRGARDSSSESSPSEIATKLVFLTREGCVNTATMRANLDEALRTLGLPLAYQVVDLDSIPEDDARRGSPTPTLLSDGHDVFGFPEPRPPLPEPT